MTELLNTLETLGIGVIPLARTLLIVIFLFGAFSIALTIIKKSLISRANGKRQKTDIENFSRLFKIIILLVIIVVAGFSYAGSFTGLGIAAGFVSAALGWALQRPITGVAAWIMILVKRPFSIGDRVIIGNVKGDVKDITLTHIVLDEIGGLVDSDVFSGRIVLVPNYQLYELNITNYTQQHDYVIGESIVQVTYESNLDKAIKLVFDSAIKYSKEGSEKLKKEPMIRIALSGSGVDIKVRYYGEAFSIQRITSDINKEIYDCIKKEKDVEIAYPHTELIFKDKNMFKKR
ncbi:mechanosensitive ion channel family protein [Candidatus Pacearchaeota archaeon]|nr:mechanosensitive ion channel family protein [Candidatus Pacearchaeota archaeon]